MYTFVLNTNAVSKSLSVPHGNVVIVVFRITKQKYVIPFEKKIF
jgi:hypothetical protein